MSNRCDPFPQMEKFAERTEAVRMQPTMMDVCYGEKDGADEIEIKQFVTIDRAAMRVDDDSNIEVEDGVECEDDWDGADNMEVEGNTESSDNTDRLGPAGFSSA
ncbi:hypothetical protein RhiJN_16086 [Ceratobasidium sp. AG-Ba]|nr:hypothetical protein RhiJN_16086 [Ceratobasidium sp. AG-Ba]